ncbi:polysaccharide deacetylase family protein [Microbispora sp. NPDC049125]|uniref:polysaccharide deacetylase family protein n=1 Tax=Microbispora sp. NPDC049125 TaxID=3154929 RepID=UPI0034676CA1
MTDAHDEEAAVQAPGRAETPVTSVTDVTSTDTTVTGVSGMSGVTEVTEVTTEVTRLTGGAAEVTTVTEVTRRTRVPILMYHSVTDQPTPATRPHAVRPADFAAQMAYLKDGGFTPLTFAGLAAALEGGGPGLPARPIVITFDDGYADFHTEALPVLDRHGFPCTVFVTSGWLDDAGAEAAGRPLDRMLTWSQVREAAAHGVEIAGHSHSHPQLDQIPRDMVRQELRRNKALLEDRIGGAVTTMAYPYGYSSARVRREVREAGYKAACAVNNAVAGDRHDLLAVPRLTVGRSTTTARFRRAAEGRGVPLIYLKERTLTRGYAVVRRSRSGLGRLGSRV